MIETARLILRPHRLADFEGYAALLGEVEPSSRFALPAFNREDAWARLLRFIGHWHELGFGLMLASERSTGRIVGELGVADFHRAADPRCIELPEAGWRIVQRLRGIGVAQEAMQAVLDWSDRTLKSAQTFCLIHPENIASLRLASRLGYEELSRGVYKDEPVISLLRTSAKPHTWSS